MSPVPGKHNSIVTLAVVEEDVLLICNTWAGPHDLHVNKATVNGLQKRKCDIQLKKIYSLWHNGFSNCGV